MRHITNLIDEGNWLGLLFVAAVLAYIGEAMIQSRPTMKLWGVRLTATTFLLFLITRAVQFGEPATADLVSAVLHGAMAAALVVGPAWIALACASFVFSQLANFRNFLRRHMRRVRNDRPDTRRDDERARQERDRAAREAVARRRSHDARKRINDAKAKALRAFHLLRSDLGDRFTDREFNEYVKAYLTDDQTPDDVEHHATKLTQLLKQVAEGAGGGVQSHGALNQRFEQQRAAIQAAPVDDELKDILLLELEEQYEEQVRNLIRRHKS
jgi:hypothetical protein